MVSFNKINKAPKSLNFTTNNNIMFDKLYGMDILHSLILYHRFQLFFYVKNVNASSQTFYKHIRVY